MNGKPVGDARASVTFPMQKRYVRRRPKVNGTFKKNDHTMLLGTMTPASSISSAREMVSKAYGHREKDRLTHMSN